jgi:hypothetical protein
LTPYLIFSANNLGDGNLNPRVNARLHRPNDGTKESRRSRSIEGWVFFLEVVSSCNNVVGSELCHSTLEVLETRTTSANKIFEKQKAFAIKDDILYEAGLKVLV